ncbi:MAG: alpha/beta fold hydrolase [Myxococcaceae bacterium]|nr:alpha/beta fold hydrolase [Myxococcaceae bacterium]
MSFVDIPMPHGRLEALFWQEPSPRFAAVICHPHPLHGGTMHNHVTYRAAQALRNAGGSVLRFNFRGVGRSTGTHDFGAGEVDDARAALAQVAQAQPGVPLVLGGFSFGCRTALELALQEPRVTCVLAVGLAVDTFDVGFVSKLETRTAFVHSEHDEFGAVASLEALRAKISGAETRLFVVPGADHLCTGKLDELSATLEPAVRWLLETLR